MTLPCGAVGWSALCDCGISRSCSLIFVIIPLADQLLLCETSRAGQEKDY